MTLYVSLSTPGVLVPDAAGSFERARTALARAGIRSGTTAAIQATRTVQQQVDLFTRHYTRDRSQPLHYPIDARPWLGQWWYRRRGYAAAAIPGTSNHGRGDTVDWQGLGDYDSRSWERGAAILTEHGWNNREGRRVHEPWHWTYVRADDKHATTPNRPLNLKEEAMQVRGDTRSSGSQRLNPNRWTTPKVTEKGGVSIGFGPCYADATVTVHMEFEPDKQVRVRPYVLNYRTGKRVRTLNSQKVDSPKTSGSTLAARFIFREELRDDERLRWEIYCWEPVTITRCSYETEEFTTN